MKRTDFNRLLTRYILGFGSSLILSVGAYLVVTEGWVGTHSATMALLLILAAIQLIVQLVCFLHLDIRGRSADRMLVLAFTVIMMLVIVIGSLWIMRNLDYRMGMSAEAMNEYMQEQNKKGF